MKLSMKIFVNAALSFALIGFVTYLFIVMISFFGCCAGMSSFVYHNIVIGLVSAGVVVFGFCLYNNCYKNIYKIEPK